MRNAQYVLITFEEEISESARKALAEISIETDVSDPMYLTTLATMIQKKSNLRKAAMAKKQLYGVAVMLAEHEYLKLCEEFGKTRVDAKIEDMNNYAEMIGLIKFRAKYVSHYIALRVWIKKDRQYGKSRHNTSRVESNKADYGKFTE